MERKSYDQLPTLIYPTTLELIIRKLLAILIFTTALLGLQFWMFFVPLGVVIGIYTFFRKRYFFFLDIFIFLIGIVLYFQYLPFIGPPVTALKLLLLSPTAPFLASISLLSKVFILVAGTLFILGEALSKTKIFNRSNKRGLIVLFISLLTTVILTIYPILIPVYYGVGQMAQFGHNCHPSKLAFPDAKMFLTRNRQTGTWQYSWKGINRLNEKTVISKISATMPTNKLFGLLNIYKKQGIIAPPFDHKITVTGAKKEMLGILIDPGANAEVEITSREPFHGLLQPLVITGAR